MTRLTLDTVTLARFSSFADPVEVCDESGRVLGYFHPVPKPLNGIQASVRSPCSDEELQRPRQQRTGRSLAEILEILARS
jgi:hypothetical protein